MGNDPFERRMLFGIIEDDETLVGGKRNNVGRGYRKNKALVAGALQRGGHVRLELIPDMTRETLHPFVNRNVRDEAATIYTDAWRGYLGIADDDTRHETVNHSQEEWVFGDVRANGIEGVSLLLKRSIVGAFHPISKKHLDRYIEEKEWRFNNRKKPHMFRDTVKRILMTDPLHYCALVKGSD